jgi:histidinol-phosphate aminotransferase
MRPVHLDRNENHYGPAPACLAALRSVEPALLHDYTRDFERGYYSELSRRLAELHGVDEKQIVLGYGCEDILKQAVHHGLRAGERCFVPSASWWYYGAIASEVDGVTVRYPLVETERCYRYDLDQLFDLHRRNRARVLLLATPNNPTGNVIEPALLPAILERFRDAMVLLDEAYWGFGEGGADSARLTAEYPNLLVLRTFSKLYGLAGARIGYGVAGRGLEGFLKFSARYLGYCRVSERLALAALSSPEYYAGIREKMSIDGRLFVELLRRFDGIRAYDSAANFLLVRFPERVAGPLRRELEARGLYAKFLDEPDFLHCARISLGTEEENARLRAAFEELLPGMVGVEPAQPAS